MLEGAEALVEWAISLCERTGVALAQCAWEDFVDEHPELTRRS
jgi:hypothetical protein